MLITVRFKKSVNSGSDALPQPGECTWRDRPLNNPEPSNFTMAASNVFSFNMTGTGQIVNVGGRAQLYCEGNQEKGYCGVVRFILERKLFIVNVNNDGQTLLVRSARFPPIPPFDPLRSVQVLGNIANDETKTGNLSGGETYRAYAIQPESGDNVTVHVSFTGRRAVALLTELNFDVITQSDATAADAHTTADAHITYRINPACPICVVFKERDGTPASFKVRMSSCDPRAEASYRTYQSFDPVECSDASIDCPANQHIFKNACGCGCQRPPEP